MTVDRNSYSNRRELSCEVHGRRLRRPGFAGGEYSASQAAATLAAIAASSRQDRRRSAPAPRRPRRASTTARRKWLSLTTGPALVFAAFMIAVTTAIASRAAIVSIAPATAAVYAHLGMPVNLRGLAIDRVRATASKQTEDSRELLVTGEIVNVRGTETPVPDLRLALRADDGRELYVWTARGPKSCLGPHERVAFRARLAAPPPGVRDVLVKFGAPGDKASFTESRS
jgi:hypothetical protein